MKRAIEAGNDLALICHRTDTAKVAATAVAELPHGMREDARDRLERFRRKVHAPLAWSDEKWRKTCDSLAVLAAEVPENDADQAGGPVADY